MQFFDAVWILISPKGHNLNRGSLLKNNQINLLGFNMFCVVGRLMYPPWPQQSLVISFYEELAEKCWVFLKAHEAILLMSSFLQGTLKALPLNGVEFELEMTSGTLH